MDIKKALTLTIFLFIGIMLMVVLVPIVANTQEETKGNAEVNRADTFIYTGTNSVGHNVTATNNLTFNNLTFVECYKTATTPKIITDNLVTFADNNWTIVANINWSGGADNNQSILHKAAYGGNGDFDFVIDAGVLGVRNQQGCMFSSDYAVDVGKFIQVAVKRQEDDLEASGDSNLTFYVNGAYLISLNLTEGCTNFTNGAITIASNTTNWGYNGSIDYIQIYGISLTNANIATTFTGLFNTSQNYRWEFNENGGTTAYDIVSSNNGVVTGCTYANDGIINVIPSTDYNLYGNGTLTIIPTYLYQFSELKANYDYDDIVVVFTGATKLVISLIALLFALGIILYAVMVVKNNMADFW